MGLVDGTVDPNRYDLVRELCVPAADVATLYENLIRSCRETVESGPSLDEPTNVRRRKYRIHNLFPQLGDTVGSALTICRRGDPVLFERLWKALTDIGFTQVKTVQRAKDIASQFSVFLKRARDAFDPAWREMMNVETALGPVTQEPDEAELYESVKRWVFTPNHDLVFDETEFRDAVGSVFRDHWTSVAPTPIDEYCQNYSWAKPSSSNGVRLVVNGRPVKRNKIATAFAMTPDDVHRVLTTPTPQENTTFQKRENNKIRMVANGSFSAFIQMDLMSSSVERGFDAGFSTLFMNNRQKVEAFQQLARPDLFSVPLDWAEFDHQPPRWAILALNDICCAHYVSAGGDPLVAEATRYGFERATVDGEPWQNGLVSGLRWTAVFGTLFSYAVFRIAMNRLRGEGVVINVQNALFQGDDATFSTQTLGESAAIILMYKELGVRMNPKKFFIAKGLTEFLRQTVDASGVRGYVWRAVGSVLWQKPWSDYILEGENRASAMANQWGTIARRGLWSITDMAAEDIARACRTSKAVARDFLNTWGGIGGGGFGAQLQGTTITGGGLEAEPVDLSNTWIARHDPALTSTLSEIYAKSLSFSKTVVSRIIARAVSLVPDRAIGAERCKRCELQGSVPVRTAAAVAKLEQYLTPDSRNYWYQLKRRASRGVCNMWWMGRYPNVSVSLLRHAPDHVSATAERLGFDAPRPLSARRPRMSTFASYALKWSVRVADALAVEGRYTG